MTDPDALKPAAKPIEANPSESARPLGEPAAGDAPAVPVEEPVSAAKASLTRAQKAQEDRLAAALRANLARRKSAARAARQTDRQSGVDDPDS